MPNNITETAVWEDGVREVGAGEPVTGGPQGTVNQSLQDLANRTAWLKKQLTDEIASINASITALKGGKEGDNAIIRIDAPKTADGLRSVNGSFWTDSGTNNPAASDLPAGAAASDWALLQLGMKNGNQKTQIYTGGVGLWLREDDASPGQEKWNQSSWVKLMTESAVDDKCTALLQKVYPVGSLYISTTATDPATLFGFGTWAKIEGRVILGANAQYPVNSTGGEASHTLTVSELPAHTHTALTNESGAHTHSGTAASNGAHYHGIVGENATGNEKNYWPYGIYDERNIYYGGNESDWNNNIYKSSTDGAHTHTLTIAKGGAHAHTITVKDTGGGKAHNNMPPYFAAYIWRRTA